MHRFLAAVTLALLAAATPAFAAGTAPSEITVTGQGTVSQPPDLAFLTATIETNDDRAQTATSQNQRDYDAFVTAMKALGIPESDIKTTYLNLNYNRPPEPAPRGSAPMIQPQPYAPVYGYVVNRGVSVTLHDPALAGKAIDAAVGARVSNIGGVSFGAEQTKGAYAQAIRLAVADAQSQAAAMAAAAHLRIVGVKAMQQGNLPQPPAPVAFASNAAVSRLATRVPSSDVRVYATVTITYEAKP
ncbi:MAG TPA: SIMPL domain-containing protein [Candidatus Baltobacteraceae bacterium]